MPQENKPIIESIRDFILTCPFLEDWHVNIDYLGIPMSYSIDPLPADPIVKKYMDGGAIKQYLFAFTSNEEFDGDTFFPEIDLSDWTEIKKEKGIRNEKNNLDYEFIVYERKN